MCILVLTDVRLAYQRYTTKKYIREDDTITVSLDRKTYVAKPGGGRDKISSTLPPQTFRITNLSANDGQAFSSSDDGEVRKFLYLLIGEHDADIAKDDTWQEGDRHYTVEGTWPSNGYETRASVTAFARVPIHG